MLCQRCIIAAAGGGVVVINKLHTLFGWRSGIAQTIFDVTIAYYRGSAKLEHSIRICGPYLDRPTTTATTSFIIAGTAATAIIAPSSSQ
jgi:hypothetical protein